MPNTEGPDAAFFAKHVCGDNFDARIFCDLWYKYCHGIDDLIDTMEDGRPTMPKDKIIGLFINAALLYNCAFYRQHHQMLFALVVTVTNAYCDSVAWEKDPLEHRRTIADVLRTCGDEMFFLVAMICGGWERVRQLSGAIRERDYLLQHTQPDDFF